MTEVLELPPIYVLLMLVVCGTLEGPFEGRVALRRESEKIRLSSAVAPSSFFSKDVCGSPAPVGEQDKMLSESQVCCGRYDTYSAQTR